MLLCFCACQFLAYRSGHVFQTACRASDLGDIESDNDSRCGSLLSSVTITHGIGCYNTTSSGSEVTYQCDEGYSLSGESHQTCQSNGAWSGSIPVCAG